MRDLAAPEPGRPAPQPAPHQADEAEAAVAVDEDLTGLAIAFEQPLEVVFGDVRGRFPTKRRQRCVYVFSPGLRSS